VTALGMMLITVGACSTSLTTTKNDPTCFVVHRSNCGSDDLDCIATQRDYICRCTRNPPEILGC
jgi:hypothetical protein